MTLHHGHPQARHKHVVTRVRETVVEERRSSAGVLAALIVALVIVGLIAWASFGTGWLNIAGTTSPSNAPVNPQIDININQPAGQPVGGPNTGGTTGGPTAR